MMASAVVCLQLCQLINVVGFNGLKRMWQDCKVMWVAVSLLKFGLNFTVVSSREFFNEICLISSWSCH